MITISKNPAAYFGKTYVSERLSKESCGILWNDLSITRLFQNDSNTFVTKWQWDLENQSGRSYYPNNMSLCLENCRLPDSLPKKSGKVFGKQVLAERFSKHLEKCRECNTFTKVRVVCASLWLNDPPNSAGHSSIVSAIITAGSAGGLF